jgi:RimJ/RimL family protein N-acetyltransferase
MSCEHRTIEMPSTTVTLRDGRRVTVRTISEQDKEGLHAAFHRLSADARYSRFMSPLKDLSDQMLEGATHPMPGHEFALVATCGTGKDELIVGGARYAAAPDSDHCEFGIAITDDWQGLGLARYLLQTLIAAARSSGFHRIEGYVLASNTAMRGLARRLGFLDTSAPDDWCLRVVSLELDSAGESTLQELAPPAPLRLVPQPGQRPS